MPSDFLTETVAVLARTPLALDALLCGLPEEWTEATEGDGTWSPRIVLGHLIHGERVDWMPRLRIVLADGAGRVFEPFDREAQFRESAGVAVPALLDQFARLRATNLERLRALHLQPEQLERTGMHPALGAVTARQLLATWAAHDLTHVVQIGRTMARRYRTEVGPWAEYLSVMK
jgi:hypothetical protein